MAPAIPGAQDGGAENSMVRGGCTGKLSGLEFDASSMVVNGTRDGSDILIIWSFVMFSFATFDFLVCRLLPSIVFAKRRRRSMA